MKKLFFLFFALNLLAQDDFREGKTLWDFHPLHVGGNLIAIGKANVDLKNGRHDGSVLFNKANLFTYFLLPISESSFFLPRLEWNSFTLDWNHNPRFKEKHFHYVQFALTFMSLAVQTWRWIARVDYNIDIKHFSHPKTYGLFSALLWGTHEIYDRSHFHVGALGYTGFSGEEVYPVIGFDYALNKKWFFQAVFPISYLIEYSFNDQWRIALKGRPLKERFRVGKYEPSPRSVFNYSTMGAEINLHYEKFLRLDFEIFVGYNFGGNLYFKNKRGNEALYTHFKSAPYGGLSVNWGI